MIPRIVHQTTRWLTPEEKRLGGRIRSLLPDWEYRLWTDKDNDSLVAEYFPCYLARFRAIPRGVVRADVARYMYLAAYGGFYFDTDYKLLFPIDQETLSCSCVLPISRNSAALFRLGNAVMGSEPKHRFWLDLIAHIFSDDGLSEIDERDIEKTTGPEGLTNFYLARRDLYPDISLSPRERFHPQLTLLGFSFRKEETTMGAHLCWGSWRTKSPVGMAHTLAVRKLTSLW